MGAGALAATGPRRVPLEDGFEQPRFVGASLWLPPGASADDDDTYQQPRGAAEDDFQHPCGDDDTYQQPRAVMALDGGEDEDSYQQPRGAAAHENAYQQPRGADHDDYQQPRGDDEAYQQPRAVLELDGGEDGVRAGDLQEPSVVVRPSWGTSYQQASAGAGAGAGIEKGVAPIYSVPRRRPVREEGTQVRHEALSEEA